MKNMKGKRQAIQIWFAMLVVVICMILFPVWWGFIRLGIILGVAFLWLGAIYIVWNHKVARILFVIATLLSTAIFLPGNNGDPDKIMAVYAEKLKTYEGVRYIWGGKNSRGIDCAGLVRKGYIDANVAMGIETGNPKLLRRAFFVWWYDCAADALGNEYRNMTTKVIDASSLDDLRDRLQPGDLVVGLPDGFHVLAYLGNNQWIEADPTPGKVVTISTTEKSKLWEGIPVRLVRWNNQL